MTLRVIDTGLRDARWNAAASAALAELHRTGDIGDTLRLHRYERSVLLGLHQDVEAIDRKACRARGVTIARRITGGGAVYMAPGVCVWEIVAARRRFASLEDAAAQAGGAVARALQRLGVPAAFAPPNSIAVGSRKISGASGAFDGETLLMHGTLLCDVDWEEFCATLSVRRDSVTSMSECAMPTPSMGEVTTLLAGEIATLWKGDVVSGAWTAHEDALAAKLLRDIGSADFVFGESRRVA